MTKYSLLHITTGEFVFENKSKNFYDNFKLALKYYKRFNIILDNFKQELNEFFIFTSKHNIPLKTLKFNLEFILIELH